MYEPSRLLEEFYIAGFKFYDGALALGKLEPGKKLKLKAAFDNPYDANAVAIYYKDKQLGYVPQDKNDTISLMVRFGYKKILECRVLQVDKAANPWNQVRVGVYLVDNRK